MLRIFKKAAIPLVCLLHCTDLSGTDTTRHAASIMLEKASSLVGDNEFFYKGHYGNVAPGFFIKRGDKRNNIYDSKSARFEGGNGEEVEVVKINAGTRDLKKGMLEEVSNPKAEIAVVFSRQRIFVLDFKAKRFGYYSR